MLTKVRRGCVLSPLLHDVPSVDGFRLESIDIDFPLREDNSEGLPYKFVGDPLLGFLLDRK